MKKKLEDMWVEYPGKPRFSFWDVYKLIKKHSTLLDRLDPRKMVFMSVKAFDIFTGLEKMPSKKNWNFIEEFKKYY